jgi:hypothetical protein
MVCGFDNEKLLDENDLRKGIKVNVIYARSCRVGKTLGGLMIKNGVKSFVGYDYDYAVCMRKDCVMNPLKDTVAKRFIEPSNYLIHLLLKGKSVLEADKKSKEMMKKEMIQLLSSGSSEDMNTAGYLYNNLVHQVVIGEGNTGIF